MDATTADLERQLERLLRSRQSGRKMQAKIATIRALIKLRGEEQKRRERMGAPATSATGGDADEDEDALDGFELMLPIKMAHWLGWAGQAEWHHGSERVDRVMAEATEIMNSDDPFASFDQWCEQHPRGSY